MKNQKVINIYLDCLDEVFKKIKYTSILLCLYGSFKLISKILLL